MGPRAGLAEPSDLVLTPDGDVVVVESAAHRLSRLAPGTVSATGGRYRTERPVTDIAPGELVLDVVFTLPPGQKLVSIDQLRLQNKGA